MTSMSVTPTEYARKTTVEVWSADHFLGSGFFAARGIVATCAHVVPGTDARVSVRWSGETYSATVVSRLPTAAGEADFYPFPDVALLRLDNPPYHPSAVLRERASDESDRIVALGYSTAGPDEGLVDHSAELKPMGWSGRYLRIAGDELQRGMSGSPAVHSSSGALFGMVKASKDFDADRGGWVTPVKAIRDALRDVVDSGLAQAARTVHAFPPRDSVVGRLLKAQYESAQTLPYRRFIDGPVPPVSQIYVRQRAASHAAEQYEPALLSAVAGSIAIEETFKRHRHVLVMGGPGAGKSMLAQHLVAENSRWWLAAEESAAYALHDVVVVRVHARDLASTEPWLITLAAAVTRSSAGYLDVPVQPKMLGDPPLPHTEWMVLIDGLDEIVSMERRRVLLDTLGYHIAQYGDAVRFVITTRALHRAELAHLTRRLFPSAIADAYGEYVLEPFDRQRLKEFLTKWFQARSPTQAGDRLASFLRRTAESRILELIRVPLLATIAVSVFEQDPVSPLPLDRAALYEKFIGGLIYERRARIAARAAITAEVHGEGSQAQEVGHYLFEHTEACLEYLANIRTTAEGGISVDTAILWLARRKPDYLTVPRLADYVNDLLLTTGLVFTKQDNSIEFVHHTFAEYLAAGYRARDGFDPRQWLRMVRRDGANNIALFTFARWSNAGNDPLPTVRKLLRHSRLLGYQNLVTVAGLLRDGVPPDRTANGLLVSRCFKILRSTHADEEYSEMMQEILPALHDGDATGIAVAHLAGSAGTAPAIRAEAAAFLAARPETATVGITELRRLALGPGISNFSRIWPITVLLDYGGPTDRAKCLQWLQALVASTRSNATMAYAVAVLARLDMHDAAIHGLILRAATPWHDIDTRRSALDLFLTVFSEAYDLEALEAYGRPRPTYWSDNPHTDPKTLICRAFVSALALLAATGQLDAATSAVHCFWRDSSLTWRHRVAMVDLARKIGAQDVGETLYSLLDRGLD
jgi:trypsin-like peptidase/NACHT domain-containing protein